MMSVGVRLGRSLARAECGVARLGVALCHELVFRRPLCCYPCPTSSLLTPSLPSTIQPLALLSTSTKHGRMWRLTMDDETKRRKRAQIETMKKEKQPVGLFAKFKYYVKRYWYIAIPVHFASSLLWFGAIFGAVKSGIDVVALLEYLHLPESVMLKVKNTPPGAGVAVLTLILYKIASPLRYATTLAGIKVVFTWLQRMGRLPIAQEVEFELRTKAEKIGRHYHKYSKAGVREAWKRRRDPKKGEQ